MAESTLSLDFWAIVERVSDYLGYGSSPAGDNFERVRRCIEDGYRQFLFPAGRQWSFLRPQSTLAITSGTWEYSLPDDFGGLIESFRWPKNTGYVRMTSISVERILALRASSDTSAEPYYYALRPKVFEDNATLLARRAIAPGAGASSQTAIIDVAGGTTTAIIPAPANSNYRIWITGLAASLGTSAGEVTLKDSDGAVLSGPFARPNEGSLPAIALPMPVTQGKGFSITTVGCSLGGTVLYVVLEVPESTGQRWEVIFYPTPSNARTMYYRPRLMPSKWANARISQSVTVGDSPYTVLTGAGSFTTAAVVAGDRVVLTGPGGPTAGLYTLASKDLATQVTMTTGAAAPGTMNAEIIPATLYHYGGLLHSQTLLASCLERAESQVSDIQDGPHKAAWDRELARSLREDYENDPTVLGYNGDGSDSGASGGSGVSSLTVNGTVVYSG